MPRRRSLQELGNLPQYYSLAEIARQLNLPFRKACRLMKQDVLSCDALLGFRAPLYLVSRLPEHAARVARFNQEKEL